jgi:hypothetical protein
MIPQYLIAGAAFIGVFVLFLVLSRTLNATINHLVKLHYLLQKELDMKKEQSEINTLLEEDKNGVAVNGAVTSGKDEGQSDGSLK